MIKFIACSFLLLWTGQATATMWIDASDTSLRHHIQKLADYNIITAPVTTYPLMWDAIDNDLLRVNTNSLPKDIEDSFTYVFHYYKRAKQAKYSNQIALSAATQAPRLSGFGYKIRDKANITVSKEIIGDFWASKMSTQIRQTDDGEREITFDDSYIAAIYGNWIFRAGAISQWWGPGWDSSLIMSNNARPLPSLSISRSNSDAFETPLLSWIGPWTFTTQMAKLESDRYVPNALLWSARSTIRPFSNLELGASWSIQWGGDGQPNSPKDFFKALASQEECVNGEAECDPSLITKLGNQIAGFDLRWNERIFDTPVSFYAQVVGEDSANSLPTDKAYTYGIDTSLNIATIPVRIFVEYTETDVACGSNPNSLNCYYEHGTYRTGYRYQGRTIGSTFDNDANMVTVGIIGSTEEMHHWSGKLRFGELNKDNLDVAFDSASIGNTVSKVAEDLVELELIYQRPVFRGMLSLQTQISHSTFINDSSDTDVNVSARWDYRY